MQTPEEAAQRQLDAYNARDLDAFLEVYDRDAEVRDLASGGLLMSGRETMRARYAELFDASPRLQCTLRSRIAHGAFVIDQEEVAGMRGGPPVEAVAIYEVREGSIRRVWFAR
ncbi:MAG: nuclear transport factor 2 family protein [Planctomycetaceae bacterium]